MARMIAIVRRFVRHVEKVRERGRRLRFEMFAWWTTDRSLVLSFHQGSRGRCLQPHLTGDPRPTSTSLPRIFLPTLTLPLALRTSHSRLHIHSNLSSLNTNQPLRTCHHEHLRHLLRDDSHLRAGGQ